MIAVALPCLVLGGMWLRGLLTLVVFLGTLEYVRNVCDYTDYRYYLMTFAMAAVTLLSVFLPAYRFQISAAVILVLFFLNVNSADWDVMKISYLFMMFSLLCVGVECFDIIRSFGIKETLMVLFETYFADSFALIGGKAFGKHKLNERISPNKTIEGSVCGYICGATIGIIWGLFMTSFSKGVVFASAFIVPFVSQVGDLAFSSIKRYFGIKDFSNIFPGHGGMLDRIDSLIFALAVFNIILGIL